MIVEIMSKLFSLEGKFAVVTGPSRGLGWAMAQGMADHGAELVLCGRNEEHLNGRVETLAGSAEDQP